MELLRGVFESVRAEMARPYRRQNPDKVIYRLVFIDL